MYASQPGSPPDHATLGSGWWPAFACRVRTHTCWVTQKVSVMSFLLHVFPLHQALPGAITTHAYRRRVPRRKPSVWRRADCIRGWPRESSAMFNPRRCGGSTIPLAEPGTAKHSFNRARSLEANVSAVVALSAAVVDAREVEVDRSGALPPLDAGNTFKRPATSVTSACSNSVLVSLLRVAQPVRRIRSASRSSRRAT